MKVRCKDNLKIALDGYTPFKLSLTIDEDYLVIENKEEFYLIFNDKCQLTNYKKDRFEIVEE